MAVARMLHSMVVFHECCWKLGLVSRSSITNVLGPITICSGCGELLAGEHELTTR